MKKSLSILKTISLLAAIVFTLTSFNAPHRAITVKCTWHANKSDLPFVQFSDNVSIVETQTNILQGTSWTTNIYGYLATYSFQTQVPGPHAAGTIRIYENGILKTTTAVPARSFALTYEAEFSYPDAPHAYYDIYWD